MSAVTCPTCGETRTIRRTVASGVARCRACALDARRKPGDPDLVERVCIQCGDVAMVKRGGKPLPRRCRSCSWARLVALNPPSHPYPRDDVDDVMVRRLMFGERDGLGSIADRLEATRRLTRDGHSAAEIALLMGVTRKSVERYRKELRNTGRLSHVAVYCDTEGVAA